MAGLKSKLLFFYIKFFLKKISDRLSDTDANRDQQSAQEIVGKVFLRGEAKEVNACDEAIECPEGTEEEKQVVPQVHGRSYSTRNSYQSRTIANYFLPVWANFLISYRFPEASSPRKWAKPTGVVLRTQTY